MKPTDGDRSLKARILPEVEGSSSGRLGDLPHPDLTVNRQALFLVEIYMILNVLVSSVKQNDTVINMCVYIYIYIYVCVYIWHKFRPIS